MIGLSARYLVPTILPVIPITYFGGYILFTRMFTPNAQLGGGPFMLVYMLACIATFIAIVIINI